MYWELIKAWEQDGVSYRLDATPDDQPVGGNVMASGDEVFDRKCEDDVLAELARGNMLAWCCLRVTARAGGCEGDDYLGCVSCYGGSDPAAEIVELFGPDLASEARDDLLGKLSTAARVYESFI